MNLRRYLLALPVVFAAGATAAACSSSSNSTTPTGDASMGGGTACTELLACCNTLTSSADMSTKTMCDTAAGGTSASACTMDLAALVKAGYCGTTPPGSGSSTVPPGSGSSTPPPSSGSGSSPHSSGSGSSGGNTGTCASPATTLPSSFVAPTGVASNTSCTSSQTAALSQCNLTETADTNHDGGYVPDAELSSCNAYLANPDGSPNSCGTCYETNIEIGQPMPTQWGYDIVFGVLPALGDTAGQYYLNYGINEGGCIYAAAKAAGNATVEKCGLDIMAINACELALCAPVCPVAISDAGALNTDQVNALVSCLEDVQNGAACQTFITAYETDCEGAYPEAGNGIGQQCDALLNQDEGADGSPVATEASQAALLGIICGGADAGF
jgi:hypothetical protein